MATLTRPSAPPVTRSGQQRPPRVAHLWHAWSRHRPVILAYHDVVDPDRFAQQLDYLAAMMHPVRVEDVLRAAANGAPLPRGAVLVTFDDGDITIHEHALPLLRERGIPAVAFVVTELIGTDRPAWFQEVRALVGGGAVHPRLGRMAPDAAVRTLKRLPDDERRRVLDELRAAHAPVARRQLSVEQLRELEEAGIEIGSHTHSHPCLDRCSDDTIEDELTRAHALLETWLGRAPRVFAYPNGNGDTRVDVLLARMEYAAAFLFDHRIGAFPPANMYGISRVRVNSTTALRRFRNIISGLHPLVHHSIGRT